MRARHRVTVKRPGRFHQDLQQIAALRQRRRVQGRPRRLVPVPVQDHDGGKAHGSVGPRYIRLALFDTPYGNYNQAYLPRHENGEYPAPIKFLHGSTNSADDAQRAVELATLARAIAELTTHPDPQIDGLLRDTSTGSHEVLGDLLLERGHPVEKLVNDRCHAPGLSLQPLAGEDDEDIDDELEALWHRVLELDPMIDTGKPGIFDLAGPPIG